MLLSTTNGCILLPMAISFPKNMETLSESKVRIVI